MKNLIFFLKIQKKLGGGGPGGGGERVEGGSGWMRTKN